MPRSSSQSGSTARAASSRWRTLPGLKRRQNHASIHPASRPLESGVRHDPLVHRRRGRPAGRGAFTRHLAEGDTGTGRARRQRAARAAVAPGLTLDARPIDARFTITVYADLECPFCQTYVPELVRWIDTHPDVNLQWQHLPLAMHEPAASREARLAECAGETQGHAGFWQAVAWIYSHTQAEGRGVPPTPAIPARHLHCGPAWTARIRWASCSDRRSKPSVTGSEVLRPCGCRRDGPAGPWSSAEPSPRTYCYPRSIFLRRRRHCAEVAGTCEALDCRHQHLFHP